MRWLTILTLIGLTGCSASIVASQDNFCRIYDPVSVSEKEEGAVETSENLYDTPETIAANDSNNGAYECNCKNNCPKKTQP